MPLHSAQMAPKRRIVQSRGKGLAKIGKFIKMKRAPSPEEAAPRAPPAIVGQTAALSEPATGTGRHLWLPFGMGRHPLSPCMSVGRRIATCACMQVASRPSPGWLVAWRCRPGLRRATCTHQVTIINRHHQALSAAMQALLCSRALPALRQTASSPLCPQFRRRHRQANRQRAGSVHFLLTHFL